jgi:hypothetical protein
VLAIDEMQAGAVPVPPVLANLMLERVLDAVDAPPGILSGVRLTRESVRLDPNLRLVAADGDLDAEDLDAVLSQVAAAQRRLQRIVAQRIDQRTIDAAEVLSQSVRSADEAADATTANRAAIIATAAYVNESRGQDRDPGAQSRLVPLELHGRVGLAEHFFTAAALQSQSGSTLTNLVGNARELSDAGTGGGFSFRDMAANRAGIRFSELAIGDAGVAEEVQRLAQSGLEAADLIPAVDWLPENVDRVTFERDFGGPDGRAYQILVEEIDRRIANLAVVTASQGD